jgi:hypothetical protein
MTFSSLGRFSRPESLTAIAIFIVAGGLLIPAFQLPAASGLLPLAMLGALMVLSVGMLIADQRHAAAGTKLEPVITSSKRVVAAFAAIILYAIAVDLIGFYPSTAFAVPLIAGAFGYRHIPLLAFATIVVVAAIYLIFTHIMAVDFPVGRVWPK